MQNVHFSRFVWTRFLSLMSWRVFFSMSRLQRSRVRYVARNTSMMYVVCCDVAIYLDIPRST